ncbi:hypothetical protein D3C72_2090400 [compost metagenome]
MKAVTASFSRASSLALRVGVAMAKSIPPIFMSVSNSPVSFDSAAKSELSRRNSARSRQPVIFWPLVS